MQFPKLHTVEDFVAWENGEAEKYEFVDGVISPFPGGTLRHEIICANLTYLLYPFAGAGNIRTSGIKLLTRASSRYPDISVGFDVRDAVAQTFARHPKLLIEILSPSTYRADRGPKFDEYRTIDTLDEYVILDSRKRWAQTIRRTGLDWVVSLPIVDGALHFASIGATLAFHDIYAGSEL